MNPKIPPAPPPPPIDDSVTLYREVRLRYQKIDGQLRSTTPITAQDVEDFAKQVPLREGENPKLVAAALSETLILYLWTGNGGGPDIPTPREQIKFLKTVKKKAKELAEILGANSEDMSSSKGVLGDEKCVLLTPSGLKMEGEYLVSNGEKPSDRLPLWAFELLLNYPSPSKPDRENRPDTLEKDFAEWFSAQAASNCLFPMDVGKRPRTLNDIEALTRSLAGVQWLWLSSHLAAEHAERMLKLGPKGRSPSNGIKWACNDLVRIFTRSFQDIEPTRKPWGEKGVDAEPYGSFVELCKSFFLTWAPKTITERTQKFMGPDAPQKWSPHFSLKAYEGIKKAAKNASPPSAP